MGLPRCPLYLRDSPLDAGLLLRWVLLSTSLQPGEENCFSFASPVCLSVRLVACAFGGRADCTRLSPDGAIVSLHVHVVRAAPAFGRDPHDVLRRVLDVAGLAVHAVLRVDLQALPPRLLLFRTLTPPGGKEGS